MSKILIIGVGGGGINAVKRMKEVGIPDANYICIDSHGNDSDRKPGDLPYYDLWEMNGRPNLPPGSRSSIWREFAENVEDEIGKIIEDNLKD